jgi:hypothetical protein
VNKLFIVSSIVLTSLNDGMGILIVLFDQDLDATGITPIGRMCFLDLDGKKQR